jgi:aspartate aminotransferase-like enzyme
MIIDEEGLNGRIARHRKNAEAVRKAVTAWGLSLFPKTDSDHAYSNTVTATALPGGIDDSGFRGMIRKMGIEIAGGQDHLKGKIFRIGTMGATSAPEILATLSVVEHALVKQGFRPAGNGVQAACEVLG